MIKNTNRAHHRNQLARKRPKNTFFAPRGGKWPFLGPPKWIFRFYTYEMASGRKFYNVGGSADGASPKKDRPIYIYIYMGRYGKGAAGSPECLRRAYYTSLAPQATFFGVSFGP